MKRPYKPRKLVQEINVQKTQFDYVKSNFGGHFLALKKQ